jgi:glucose dehydrogenase
MYERCPISCCLLLPFVAGVSLLLGSATIRAQSAADFVPVTDAMLQNPDAADWLNWRRTLDGWGYSPLDQINTENVDSSVWPGRGR